MITQGLTILTVAGLSTSSIVGSEAISGERALLNRVEHVVTPSKSEFLPADPARALLGRIERVTAQQSTVSDIKIEGKQALLGRRGS